MKKICFGPRFREIYLMLTEFCPNRCVYCYIKNRDQREALPMEYVDALLEAFQFQRPRVIFFGGEPLIELKLIERIMEKYWHRCRFQIVTSASANYEAFIEEIYPRFPIPEIQISWDGPDNANRPDIAGVCRQDAVWDKILWTLEHGVAIDIKCVINEQNAASVGRIYNCFIELMRHYPRLVHGDFVVAHQTSFQPGFHDALCSGLQDALAMLRSQLEGSYSFYIPRDWLNKMLAIIAEDRMRRSSCDAGNYIVMRPNGDLYPCTIFSQLDYEPFRIGNICNSDLRFEVFDEIRAACRHEDCSPCRAGVLCDGGCRYERYAVYGPEFDRVYCPHQCKTTKLFYDVFSQWLRSLSAKSRCKLNEYLQRYQRWTLRYSLGGE